MFDCRHDLARPQAGEQAYTESHIPGARFLHLDRDLAGPATGRNGRHPLPEPQQFADRLATCGVRKTSQIIAYDDSGGIYAARLWWLARWLGHNAVAVLNGGWNTWVSEEHPVSPDIPAPGNGDFKAVLQAGGVDVDFVLNNLGSPEIQILDARAEDRFQGENETRDPVGGHIPGALNRFFRHNLDANGRFKTDGQLRDEFACVLRDTKPAAIVHQCGSGVTACHNLLAMEIAGLSGSRLYAGSWSEWCAEPSRPVAIAPAGTVS